DGDLVGQVVHRGPGEALDHMLLVAVDPPLIAMPNPFIDGHSVDDQCISIPMANTFAAEGGVWAGAMRTPIERDNTIVVICLRHLRQEVAPLHKLRAMRPHAMNARHTIPLQVN